MNRPLRRALNFPFRIGSQNQSDHRGSFTKVIDMTGEFLPVSQMFWSRSTQGVIRGFHFQEPPYACARVVFVVRGCIRDFIVDINLSSADFGTLYESTLDPQDGAVLIPATCAHGFEVVSEEALVVYALTGPYSEDHDKGFNMLSVGLDFVSGHPLQSKRDAELQEWGEFRSPFLADVNQ